MTYSYITKNTRIRLGVQKPHINDACCIAGNLDARFQDTIVMQTTPEEQAAFQANTLQGPEAEEEPGTVEGFRLFDKVRYMGQKCFVAGRRQTGYFTLRMLDGTCVHTNAKVAHLTLIEERKGYLIERRERQFLPCL